MVQSVIGVDPDGSSLKRVRDLDGGVEVLGMHGGREAVGGRVADLDGLLLRLEFADGADGAEDLLLHNLHVLGDVGEDGGLDEVTLVALAIAADLDLGACVFAGFDVAGNSLLAARSINRGVIGRCSLHDAVELHLRDLRALEGVLRKWVANDVLLCPLLELLNELVVNGFLHVDTGTGAATLAVVEEDTEVNPGNGIINVRVLEDDIWRFATELERDLLQVGARGSLEDRAADDSRASEGDLVDVHVRGKGGTSRLAKTRDDVDDTWREASLLGESGSDETTKRSLLGSLQNNGVSASNRRADLPRPHEQWEVPWDDLSADANGLLLDVVEGIWRGIDDLAVDLVRPAAVVSQAADAHADVDLGHGCGLAVIERLNRGKEVEVLLEKVGELDEQLAAVLRGLLPPWALECLASCLYRDVDVLLGRLGDLAGDALVGWVDNIKSLTIYWLHELIVDEAGRFKSAFATTQNAAY